MINQTKFKQLGIKPDRVRALIEDIEAQGFDIESLKKEMNHAK